MWKRVKPKISRFRRELALLAMGCFAIGIAILNLLDVVTGKTGYGDLIYVATNFIVGLFLAVPPLRRMIASDRVGGRRIVRTQPEGHEDGDVGEQAMGTER